MASTPIQHAFEQALQLHQAGRLADAERFYQQVLAANPRHVDATHNLGVLARQVGNRPAAAELFRRTIVLDPHHSDAYSSLGVVLRDLGQLDASVAACKKAIALRPDYAEAFFNLGHALKDQGNVDQAIAAYRRAVALKPRYAEAHSALAVALCQDKQIDEAITACRRAISIKPDFAPAYGTLGIALLEKKSFDEAITACKKAIALQPTYAEAFNNMGNALTAKGEREQAVAAYRQALALKPGYADACSNLAMALMADHRLDEAIATYELAITFEGDRTEAYIGLGSALREAHQSERSLAAYQSALALKPDHVEALSNCAAALIDLHRDEEAIALCLKAISLQPDFAAAHANMAISLRETGRIDESIAECRLALQLKPDVPQTLSNLADGLSAHGEFDEAFVIFRRAVSLKPNFFDAHSCLVYMMNYHPGCDPRTIADEHREWNRLYAQPLQAGVQPYANDRNPDRRLRIGYVSGDFKEHAVAHFLLPLLQNHDHSRFEIFCYSSVIQPDRITQIFHATADGWRNMVGQSDDDVFQMIRNDGIDILVDLAGHTAGNRLLMFAMKPAPVQVSFLGYPATTGLDAIDYRLTDEFADPPGMTDGYCSESLWRLPKCAWCYQPLSPQPPVSVPPAIANQYITFGSFNNFNKVNQPLLEQWAGILHRVPGSKLLLKARNLRSEAMRQKVSRIMHEAGISPDRLDLRSWVSPAEHLTLYNQIDIALDAHPYNGTTTSCEALSMGVPMVALSGHSHVARVGTSLLNNLGLGELVGETVEQMQDIAVSLATDLPRLQNLRSTLRQRMQQSPLMNGPMYAQDLETAFREMWRKWVAARQ